MKKLKNKPEKSDIIKLIKETSQNDPFDNLNLGEIHYKDFRDRIESRKCISIDFGKKGIVAYNAFTEKSEILNLESLLDLPHNPDFKGYSIVVEDSHLGIPKDNSGVSFSKAQYYTSEQLLKFYRDCYLNNISLRFFPQKMTPKIHAWSGMLKSDENDPVALYKYILDHPKLTLKKPMRSFDSNSAQIKKMIEGRMHKKNTNQKLDFLRSYSLYGLSNSATKNVHDCECPLSNLVYNGLVHAIKNNILSESELEMIGLVKAKAKSNSGTYKGYYVKGDFRFDKVKMNVLCSVISPMFGQVQFDKKTGQSYMAAHKIERELGGFISWKFAKQYIFEFKPQSLKGGTARSNILYHFARCYIINQAKGTAFENSFRQKYKDEEGKSRSVANIITYLERGQSEAVKDTLGITLNIVDGDVEFFYAKRKEALDLIKKLFFLYRNYIDSSDVSEMTGKNWTQFNASQRHDQVEMFN